ncbi:hypothetical protein ScoT_00760 [Streptomyces albidoflavus]|uniref:Uncharacterized protein n=1 Tax=Streptomyces albidoflavus TaxID=1886 RepID=A0AA37BSZ5_9ACTN|nr:hypothetical protein ScoT_00760 [Streptomyces albidoflavus]
MLTAPQVVDEDVQPPLLALDTCDQGAHLFLFEVVGGDREADATGGRHQIAGLLDGFRGPADLAGSRTSGAAGYVDRGTEPSELGGQRATGAACGPGDKCDSGGQRGVAGRVRRGGVLVHAPTLQSK